MYLKRVEIEEDSVARTNSMALTKLQFVSSCKDRLNCFTFNKKVICFEKSSKGGKIGCLKFKEVNSEKFETGQFHESL